MNYSVTIAGIIVALVGTLGQKLHVDTSSVTLENLQAVTPMFVTLVGLITAWYGRIRHKDVSLLGFKDPK